MVSVEFTTYIEERLEESGHSMRRVAKDAGISASFLSRILAGERGLPPDDSLLKLGRALGIDPPEQVLVHAGRIPTNLDGLSQREIQKLYASIRDLMTRHRRPRRNRSS